MRHLGLPDRRRRSRRALTAACAAFLVLWASWEPAQAPAHPPRVQRERAARERSAAAQAPQQTAVGEQDRQVAYFQFEFLADVAARCPLDLHQDVVGQLIEEQRLAAGLPQAGALDEVVAARQGLLQRLRERFIWMPAVWSPAGLHWQEEPPALELAQGLRRFVVVEVHNATEAALDLAAGGAGTWQTPRPWTVLPGRAQPFLLELDAAQPTADLEFSDGSATRTLALPATVVAPARLRLSLRDGDARRLTSARVWVECSDRQFRRAGPFAQNGSFTEKPILELPSPRWAAVPFFYADGSCEIVVPPGRTTVTLERGFEHLPVAETLELAPGETRDLALTSRRFIDARAAGWISGDTHIHWVTNAWNVDLPLADLALVQRAEDLRVANNLTLLHRTAVDAFIKPSQAPVGPVVQFSDGAYHLEMAEEYRNQNLYGHLCFLDLEWLVLPIGTGPQIAGDDSLDYPLNRTAILAARGQGGISIEAHGTGANHELPANAVQGLTDSIDQIDPADYYRLLDCGFQLPLTNGSDHPARIAGCARAYVRIDGEFAYEKWIDGIRRGRTFTTSGPLLFLTVDGQEPGSVLTPAAHERPTARLRAVSRFPLGRVQLLSNGEVLQEIETSEREIALECPVPTDGSRWVVARCSRNDRWNALWQRDVAHTSAIYIQRDGRPVFRTEAATEWIERLRLHARDIQTKGRFANDAQRDEALAYVDESIRRYERLVALHGRPAAPSDFALQRERLLMQAAFASHLAHEPAFLEQVQAATQADQLCLAAEPLTLLRVHINPESRVKLAVVSPPESVVQHRTHRFLVEVHNEARIQAPLQMRAVDLTAAGSGEATWAAVRLVENVFSTALLSGEEREWKLIELRCSAAGRRELHLVAEAGQGTQDLGFRAGADLLLHCVPRSHERSALPIP